MHKPNAFMNESDEFIHKSNKLVKESNESMNKSINCFINRWVILDDVAETEIAISQKQCAGRK